MASTSSLVSKLPQRLQNFFARYPPQIYSAAVRPPPSPEQQQAAAASPTPTNPDELTETPYTPNRDAKGNKRPDPTVFSPSRALLHTDPTHPNPFLPFKSPHSNRWVSPRVGLRRQAELVKLAIRYNVEALLPSGRKSTEFKETRRAERGGLAVKGTGVGQKVKGHKWERTMETRLDERRKAMMEMPEMIRLWKQVSSFSLLFQGLKRVCGLISYFTITERSWTWLEAVAQKEELIILKFVEVFLWACFPRSSG